jgi:hypothetical protein
VIRIEKLALRIQIQKQNKKKKKNTKQNKKKRREAAAATASSNSCGECKQASKQAKCMMTDVHTYIPASSNERHEEHQEGCSNGHPNYDLDSTKQQALQNSTFNYIYYNSSAAAQQQ